MSFVVWRLLHGWLPVEEVQKSRGVQLASRCVCFIVDEKLSHVFFSNPVAQQIWRFLADVAGFRHDSFMTMHQALMAWSLSALTKGHIRQVVPIVTLSALWEARNKRKHNNVPYYFHNIRWRIVHILSNISRLHMDHSKFWYGDAHFASYLGIQLVLQAPRSMKVLRWAAPKQGRLKLNIDSSFKEGVAGFGGILRDHIGDVKAVIGKFKTSCRNPLVAEVEATLWCLLWVSSKQYTSVEVEVDSQQLVAFVDGNSAPWEVQSTIQHIRRLLHELQASITHIYREQNSIADSIAKLERERRHSFALDEHHIPKFTRRIVRLEQLGVPYIRTT